MTKRVLIPYSAIMVAGEYFRSRNEAARHFGVEVHVVKDRLKRGWTTEQAFGVDAAPDADHVDFVGIVYLITNTKNKRVYIGITTNALEYRIKQHVKLFHKGVSNKLYDAMRQIGARYFRFQELARTASRLELRNLEKQFIAKYNSVEAGYNMAHGGAPYGRMSRTLTIHGQQYANVRQAADALGLHENTIYSRMRAGRDFVSAKPRRKRASRV